MKLNQANKIVTEKLNKYAKNAKQEDVARIEKKVDGMNRGPVKKIWDKVMDLWNVVKSPDIHWSKKAMAVGALIYLISPIDAIPDAIPVAGLTDDVAVILLVFKNLKDLIDAVKQKTQDIINESKQKTIEAASDAAAIHTREHLRRLKFTLIASITTAVLAIAVAVTIRLLNRG